MKGKIPLLLLILIAFSQCKPAPEKKVDILPLPEDFEVFFDHFHKDSLFQIEHITFPLEGVKKVNDGPGNILVPVHWQQDEWVLHKAFNDFDGSFTRTYRQVGPVIIEYITDQNDFFSMERRFAKIDGEWHLIYYALKK
jgi:hypothetical protein